MKNDRDRIIECINYLHSIRFPCTDWKEDKVFFDELENEFSEVPADAETNALLDELKKLIYEKRTSSLNCNKTAEELFAGWNDE